jgi:signal transduction histidine kinase
MARPGSPRQPEQRAPGRHAGETAEQAPRLEALSDRLEAAVLGQRELVRHTTHELRDALTIIGGHVELLGDDAEERRQMIGLVLEEVAHMARIVHELQLLTDAQEPDFLHLERLELAPLLHVLVEEASYLAPRRWQLDSVAATTLVADRLRLREAVLDLAHNALQTTREEDTVGIGASVDDETVRIWVRDTGRGIARSDQAGIFDRFVRRSRGSRGTGLGLAVVKAIAEAHGGHVELESRVGAGSTLTIVLSRRLELESAEREAS